MVFVVAHYNSLEEAQTVANKYNPMYQDVILCGSADFNYPKNETLAYHPIFRVGESTSIPEQHAYIDAMLRAIQIQVPEAIIFHGATRFDTATVLFRIQQHCNTVGVLTINA
jgi:hypothetical protein